MTEQCQKYNFINRNNILLLGFSQTHNIGNIAIIANFVFLHYLYNMMLVNVKLVISGKKRIIFMGCGFYWSNSFLKAQLK